MLLRDRIEGIERKGKKNESENIKIKCITHEKTKKFFFNYTKRLIGPVLLQKQVSKHHSAREVVPVEMGYHMSIGLVGEILIL